MLTWPNRITLFRILCIPLFVIGMLHAREHRWLQIALPALFVLLAVADSVDGYLARRLQQHSAIGAFLDPLADKFTMSSAAILMAVPSVTKGWIPYPIPNWLVVLLIARDLLILAGYMVFYLQMGIHKVQPSPMGKLTTAIQMGLVLLTLLSGTIPKSLTSSPIAEMGFWVVWLATMSVTVLSGLDYLRRASRSLSEGNTLPLQSDRQ